MKSNRKRAVCAREHGQREAEPSAIHCRRDRSLKFCDWMAIRIDCLDGDSVRLKQSVGFYIYICFWISKEIVTLCSSSCHSILELSPVLITKEKTRKPERDY